MILLISHYERNQVDSIKILSQWCINYSIINALLLIDPYNVDLLPDFAKLNVE